MVQWLEFKQWYCKTVLADRKGRRSQLDSQVKRRGMYLLFTVNEMKTKHAAVHIGQHDRKPPIGPLRALLAPHKNHQFSHQQ